MLFPDDKNEFQDSSTIADIRFYLDNRRPSAARAMYHMAKRLLDIAGSLFLILLFLPLLLTIPVLIKLLSPGPVFYTQKRVGQRGSLFTFIKFRSMRVDSDSTVHQQYIRRLIAGNNHAGTPGVYKLQNDPRVTSLGRILRKTSLDELPQLFNVLMGDMSLVGPRPALPYEITHYRLWHWRRVLEIKPGLTGFWQVEGRSNSDFETMVRMDLCYIRHQNLLWDLALIFRTPRAMIRGAY
jgi:lipopolysaccharide/colanic/teichoic acid biosynthesis glycosyltransferase